ncbi:MAG TPA: AraC family transcriptional regulator [Blastocatellia bacterium]|nr:AraC family transcriptional regulator [Blastocatellia bacterium]
MAQEVHRIITLPQFNVRHTACAHLEFQPHAHIAHTVTAILRGRMDVTVGNASFTALEGQTLLTEAAVTHSGTGSEVEFISVGIDPVLLSELASEIGLARASADMTFRTSLTADENIVAIARTVAAEISSSRPGLREMLDALLRQLAIHLLRTHLTLRKPDRIELSRAGPVDRRLRRAIEFMHDNYSRELMLEEIASAAYLSEYHFARMFKLITGVTPHLYLANLRLERARKLLVETSHPISEIAAMVGYQSQSHFTKLFKSVTGVTPRAFRDAARAESASHR